MEETFNRIKNELVKSTLDALTIFGGDNIQYLSGAKIPFIHSYPESGVAMIWLKTSEPSIICPTSWKETFKKLSLVKRYICYECPEDLLKVVGMETRSSIKKNARIGVDMLRISASKFEELNKILCDYKLESCDDFLKKLRSVKTDSEIKLLENVAYQTDHGIFGTAHHVLVTSNRSEMSLSEEIRVHCMERGLDVIGFNSVSQVASGEHARKFWPLAPNYGVGFDKLLRKGEYVRMEAKTSKDGYWSDAARLMVMGEPTSQQRSIYEALVALRNIALSKIRPGVKCCEVYEEIHSEALKQKIDLVNEVTLGHGIGVTDFEAPYISAWDTTKLEKNMVLVIDLVIKGSDGEFLRSKDTVAVTDSSCIVIGWYKDWREPYIANYTL